VRALFLPGVNAARYDFFADFLADDFPADFFADFLPLDFLADFFAGDLLVADFLAVFVDDFLPLDLLADFFADFFRGGTLPPSRRASESPIAIACLRLVTFLPEPPLRNVPSLRSCIARLTFACAFLPYFAIVSSLRSSGRPSSAAMRCSRCNCNARASV
jgi:hypothetical protein